MTDKEKQIIEAAREVIEFLSEREFYYINGIEGRYYLNNISKIKTLKEALEDKPSRAEVIKYHEDYFKQIAGSDSYSLENKMTKATIELLKQPTMQWVKNTGKAPDCKRVIAKCYDGYGYDLYEDNVADLDFDLGIEVIIVEYMIIE